MFCSLCLLPLLLLSGCCPIPVPTTEHIIPEAVITVVDAESGEPISGAEVMMVRYERYHGNPTEQTHTETRTTDDDGVATFEEDANTKLTILMMHGSPSVWWGTCVRHEDYETANDNSTLREYTYGQQDGPWEVTVEMTPGESTHCETDEEPGDEAAGEADIGPRDVGDFSDVEQRSNHPG